VSSSVKKRLQANSITAVLFDLDDTLLDSLKARVLALEQVFLEVGITGLEADKFMTSLNGSPFKEALKKLEQAKNIKDDLFIKYRRAYWFRTQDSLQLFPGVRDMLDELKAVGCKLGIATSKMHDVEFEGCRIGCAGEIEKLGIVDLFATVIGLEDVTHPKPHPQCIYLALEKIGAEPGSTLVVGDSAADIEAALSAGCQSCQAIWGIAAPDSEGTERLPADFVASSPDDVIRIVKGNS
jgi:pyrophosphatase PpaX